MFTGTTLLAAGIGLFAGGVLAAGSAQAAPDDTPRFRSQAACMQDVRENNAQNNFTCQFSHGAWIPVRFNQGGGGSSQMNGNKMNSDNDYSTDIYADLSDNSDNSDQGNIKNDNKSQASTGPINVKGGDQNVNIEMPETGAMGSFGNGIDKLLGGSGSKGGGGLGGILGGGLGGILGGGF